MWKYGWKLWHWRDDWQCYTFKYKWMRNIYDKLQEREK